ncbi:MAG: hypothetical protein M1832_005068 [Thelocarpon impressellum]|nr:MAG: hypothetical protein M1832_005068 [Thelocarpon impressellum]
MSADSEESVPRNSAEFVETAVLETLVPHASNIDIENELSNDETLEDDDDASPLSNIPQRRLLYFDEQLDVYVILRVPYQGEDVLKSYLSRLAITLEAHAVNLQPPQPTTGDDVPPVTPMQTRDLIYSAIVNDSEEPLILVHVREEEYLPSMVPAGLNLLESFHDDPALAHIAPRLSALRVSRVVPAAQVTKELLRPLRNSSQQTFRAVPAVSARVRYSRLTKYTSQVSVIALLDFEVTPVAECNVALEAVEVRLGDGTCEDLMGPQGLTLPLKCGPKDDVTFLYRLTPNEGTDPLVPHMSNFRSLEIYVSITAFVSEDCRPEITMRWRTNVDLSATVNPTFGGPSQSLQRSHRPTSLPMTPSADGIGSQTVVPGSETQQPVETLGVTLSISGPARVYEGLTFKWVVSIVNRSSSHRKLALVAIPGRRRVEVRKQASRVTNTGGSRGGADMAAAVVDENVIYAMQKGAHMETAELVSISSDVRVGPLAPGACHTAELEFLALGVGVLHVEAVRVTDLATQLATDILELPSIVSSVASS